MGTEQPPPDFKSSNVNPALILQHNATVGDYSLQHLGHNEGNGGASWDSTTLWKVVIQDRVDDGWQDSMDLFHFDQSFQFPNPIANHTSLDHSDITCINSEYHVSQPFQPTHDTSAEEHHLDSFKALSNSSNDTESSVLTPTSSSDDNVPVVPAPITDPKPVTTSSSRKRRLAEMKKMTLTFPIREDEPPVGRTKKPYSPGRRTEVAKARQEGVCARCKFRKVSFSLPRPCYQCQKSAGSVVVARWLCIRETFIQVRFGGFDILFESFTQDFLQNEIGTYDGPQRQLLLGLTYDQYSPHARTLPVMVQDYVAPGSEDEILYIVVATDETSFTNIASERYAITAQSMPTMFDLLGWVQMDMPAVEWSAVQRLIIALKDFMSQYCDHQPPLPMQDLLENSVKLLKLVHCWRSRKKVIDGNGSLNGRLVSKATCSQILQVVKKGIRETEQSILKALERPIYGASGPGEKNMIPLWACLWSLILTYRDCMVVYKQFSLAPRLNKKQPGCSDHEMLIGASKHMYNILTATYSALFRESSPLYLDWSIATNFNLIGNSPELRGAFCDLRDEVTRFWDASHQLVTEDNMLKSMIIEQEKKLRPVDGVEIGNWLFV